MKRIFPVLEYVNIPNLATSAGLLFGIAACYFIVLGSMRGAFLCVAFAMLMDLIDGFLADRLKQKTLFGQYLDSLVDFFICCVMPMLLTLTFVGNSLWLVSAVAFSCVCGLWRLAHFNVTAAEKKPYFTGLPVPGGALLISMAMWLTVHYDFPQWVSVAVSFVTGLLMISYFKLQKYGLWQKMLWGIGMVFFVIILMSD